MQKLKETVNKWNISGRRICILKGAHYSQPEQISNICEAMAGEFDYYLLDFIDGHDQKRSLTSREFQQMHFDALVKYGVSEEKLEFSESEQQAVERGVQLAQPGDLLVVCADDYYRTWDQINAAWN